MESINKLHQSDGQESPTLSFRDLPLHSNGMPSQTNNSFSPPPELVDFSFPVPTAADENNSSAPKLTPFVHRRAESLAADDRRLRRARSDPRPSPAAGRWTRWPFFAMGSLKHPVEMRDMRSRGRQRRPPEVVECCGGQRNCWRILRALSCKAAESTSVAPLGSTGRPPLASSCIGVFGKAR